MNKEKKDFIKNERKSRASIGCFIDENDFELLSDFRHELNLDKLFCHSVLGNHLKLAKKLLELGANINYVYPSSHTILFKVLVSKNSYEKVKFLVDNGADINYRDIFFRTALTYAYSCFRENLNYDCAKLLIDSGIDINEKDFRGNHYLQNIKLRKEKSDDDIANLLIENGA